MAARRPPQRVRLAQAAEGDAQRIIAESAEAWGEAAARKYAALLAAAVSTVAEYPEGPLTRARNELSPGARTFHLRHVRGVAGVKAPVHLLVYRLSADSVVEIIRILHERMDPSRHLDQA